MKMMLKKFTHDEGEKAKNEKSIFHLDIKFPIEKNFVELYRTLMHNITVTRSFHSYAINVKNRSTFVFFFHVD